MYGRKAYGPHRRRSQQALARDITASIVAARQRGQHRPITLYTQDADMTRLVEQQLAEAVRDSQLAQEGGELPYDRGRTGSLLTVAAWQFNAAVSVTADEAMDDDSE